MSMVPLHETVILTSVELTGPEMDSILSLVKGHLANRLTPPRFISAIAATARTIPDLSPKTMERYQSNYPDNV